MTVIDRSKHYQANLLHAVYAHEKVSRKSTQPQQKARRHGIEPYRAGYRKGRRQSLGSFTFPPHAEYSLRPNAPIDGGGNPRTGRGGGGDECWRRESEEDSARECKWE